MNLTTSVFFAALCVIATPSLLILDRRVTNNEGIIMILLYGILLLLVQRKKGILDATNQQLLNINAYSPKDILKIIGGVAIVFVSSNIIVDKTMFFADVFNISAFYIGLIVIALGTNLPELSLAIRSVKVGKKDVAMGDYVGSAAANTLLFGIFTLLNDGEVLTVSNFVVTFVFIITAMVFFYIFFRTQNFISRTNAYLLLTMYFLFLFFELIR